VLVETHLPNQISSTAVNQFVQRIIRYRLAIIVAVGVVTLLAAWSIRRITVNSNFMSYLPSDDETVKLFDYVDTTYCVGNVIVVGVQRNEGIVCQEGFGLLDDLTEACAAIDGVEKALSLTNTMDIRSENDDLTITKLYGDEFQWTDSATRALQHYIATNEIYAGRLLSPDGRLAPILVFLSASAEREVVAQRVQDLLAAKAKPELQLYLAGMPVQQLELTRGIMNDLRRLIPIIVLVMAVILFLSFRSKRGVLLPMTTVGISVVWTLGLMALLGVPLTPVSASIPVVLFAVGSAYSIHVLNFTRLSEDGSPHREVVIKGLRLVVVPVLLAGVTTVVGFLSFIPGAYLSVIREFGLFMSIGVLFCLMLSLAFLPAMDSYFRSPRAGVREQTLLAAPIFRWTVGVILHRSGRCILVLVLIALGVGYGITRISSNIDVLYYFKQNTIMRRSARVLNQDLGGTLPVQVLVRGDMNSLETLRAMQRFTERLDTLRGVQNQTSLITFFRRMNEVMGEGYRLPDAQEKVDNLWFLLEGESTLEQYCAPDRSESIIHCTMRNGPSEEYHRVTETLRAMAQELSTGEVSFAVTGVPPIYANFDDNLIHNLYSSLAFACVFVFLCMVALMRSFRQALIGFVPLLTTIVVMFGTMGFLGIHLDLATVLIAGVAVGTGIDYSIHFMTGFRKRVLEGMSREEAIRQTLLTSGRGVVFNVFSVACGFLVLLFASLVPLQQFGLLMAITMCISGVAALILLPAIIMYSHCNRK